MAESQGHSSMKNDADDDLAFEEYKEAKKTEDDVAVPFDKRGSFDDDDDESDE